MPMVPHGAASDGAVPAQKRAPRSADGRWLGAARYALDQSIGA